MGTFAVVKIIFRRIHKVILERDLKSLIWHAHIRDFCDLDLMQGVVGHSLRQLPYEHIIEYLGIVYQTLLDWQVVILFEQSNQEVSF